MFGYVRAYKPELKYREFDVYKGIYCSLCGELGRRYSPPAQLALTYDGTFLALVRMAAKNRKVSFVKRRCPYNPLKKCNKCGKGDPDICFAADMSVILFYYKLRDNISDRGFLKKIVSLILLPIFSSMRKKAAGKYAQLDRVVSDMMKKQRALEKKMSVSIDEAADPSATALGEIMSFGIDEPDIKAILKSLGYFVGRWVYIADAADDFYDDIKKKNFNPFINKVSADPSKKDELVAYAQRLLQGSAAEAIKACQLLDKSELCNIAENILIDGLHNSMLFILQGVKNK